MTRRPQVLADRVDSPVEIVKADVFDFDSLVTAMQGIDTAFYLIHSMAATGDFESEDRLAAENFARAAAQQGIRRIIYVGGLGEEGKTLSKHLRSRHETGKILKNSAVQVLEFRASIIIGSGSLSFEIIRSLVERLPIMLCPRWVRVEAQPVAVEDVLDYLIAALSYPGIDSRIFEVGGPDRVSYGDLMREYARQRGLSRLLISVPVLTPRLSSLWLGLITPVYARIGKKLVDSLKNPTVVKDDSAARTFSISPRPLTEAIRQALLNEDRQFAETRWSDAFSSSGPEKGWGGVRFGSRLVDSRTCRVNVPPQSAFAPIQRIGGAAGWYYGSWLWRVRGFLDLLFGGVGVRRGRPHPVRIRIGDAIDFWRVESFTPDRLLRLQAEMKLPGRAWLEFEVTGDQAHSTIRQTAIFDPVGLLGLLYWYGVFPLHRLVFAGMLKNLARACELTGVAAIQPPEGEVQTHGK